MSIRDKMIETPTYKKLDQSQQNVLLKKESVRQIEHGFNVATNIGVDKWESLSGLNDRQKNIVKDLLKAVVPDEPSIDQVPVKSLQLKPVQVEVLNTLKSFSDYQKYLNQNRRWLIEGGQKILLIGREGHILQNVDLLLDNQYPVSVCLTVRVSVKKVEYKSLSNN